MRDQLQAAGAAWRWCSGALSHRRLDPHGVAVRRRPAPPTLSSSSPTDPVNAPTPHPLLLQIAGGADGRRCTSPSAVESSGLVLGSDASAAGSLPPAHAPTWGVVGTSGLRSRLCASKFVLAEHATAARRASARQRVGAPPSARCRLLPRRTCYGDIVLGLFGVALHRRGACSLATSVMAVGQHACVLRVQGPHSGAVREVWQRACRRWGCMTVDVLPSVLLSGRLPAVEGLLCQSLGGQSAVWVKRWRQPLRCLRWLRVGDIGARLPLLRASPNGSVQCGGGWHPPSSRQ